MGQKINEQTYEAQENSPRTPIWKFVPPNDYAVPTVHMQKPVSKAWQFFQQIFRRKDVLDVSFKKEYDLYSLPRVQLAHLVPSLPWEDVAVALDTALRDWMADEFSENSVKFFIGQPFSEHPEVVSHLGVRHQAVEITPPSIEQILFNEKSWFDSWPSYGTFWVLPKLEHCYLRHANGLSLVRRLLRLAVSGQLGKGVIGCDSWAWAYVQRIFPLPQADAITLQAFDADRLQRLIYGLMKSQSNTKIHYYSAKHGQEITGISAEEGQRQKEFEELAAYCRGNVAIATTYWRERLTYRQDGYEEPFDGKTKMHTDENRFGEHLWVTAMPPEPELPIGNDEEYCLLLHAIMLHGGLPESLLRDLLPFSAIRCRGLLGQMQQFGIVHCANGCWQVREMAYIVVRRLLSAHGYLTDSF
ncbi:hypothetical protein [Flexistipes sp.]|uniref:hypothetical protein n=1 Tax=Flexistipes sp. TaxID=3088135 RepID=UPI002E1F6E30|nr:hypothetical protein [Flexistipes sp.]